MRPTDEIEKIVKQMSFKAGPEMDNDLWSDATRAHDQTQKPQWSQDRPRLRKLTMNVRRMKIAAAALIAVAMLLPLSYGAARIVRSFRVERVGVVKMKATGGVDNEAVEYAKRLIREGKAKEISPGVYGVILPNGKKFILSTSKSSSSDGVSPEMRTIMEEVEALRQAGDFEETLVGEITANDGRKVLVYEEVFTLSDGTIQKFTRKESSRQAEDGIDKEVEASGSGASDE